MKRSIVAVALAAFAVIALAKDPYQNSARKPDQGNVFKQQLADASDWKRSRPGADEESTGDSSQQQG
jgi:hypothetical protein